MKIRLLEADPGLRERLSQDELAAAHEALEAGCFELDPGAWTPDRSEPARGHLGYLIAHGLMLRELSVAGASSVELLSDGDLLRPWLEDSASFVSARWEVLESVLIAELDPGVAAALARWPALEEEIVDRAMRRSRSLAVHAAIKNIRGLSNRLLVLFWHLAERYGRLEADGILLPLRMTHETLARLIGARRPSVTTALSVLARDGRLERVDSGWLLRGEAPSPDA